MLRKGKAESDFVNQRKSFINRNTPVYFKGSLQEHNAGQPEDFQHKMQLDKTISTLSHTEGDVNTFSELRTSASLRYPGQGSL